MNRQHECPECRAKLTKDDLFRNFSLETLLEKLNEERDKEQHRYFANLAGNAGLDQPQNNQQADKSPIETVFALNLRESLLAYQEYFESLQKEKDQLKVKVRTSLSQRVLQAR